jgi:dihydroorotate dehydrogenase (NAD+) catalytic subunit
MKNKINLEVNIGGIRMKNPVMPASGTFGFGEEYSQLIDLNKLGAVVTKGTTLKPKSGNPPPRLAETFYGIINSIGLENPGVEMVIKEKLPFLRQFATNVIVNIAGNTIDEFGQLAKILNNVPEVHGLEVNVSCPNVHGGNIPFGSTPEMVGRITRRVRQATKLPIIIKLSPNVGDIKIIARAAEENGADAVSLVNTYKAAAFLRDLSGGDDKLILGGQSGPAIKNMALRMVLEAVEAVKIPVIGIGGISNARDAIEFLAVGTRAVQVGTANFLNPMAMIEIIKGIEGYLKENEIQDVKEIIGIKKIFKKKRG